MGLGRLTLTDRLTDRLAINAVSMTGRSVTAASDGDIATITHDTCMHSANTPCSDRRETQLPLREQGVSFVLSSRHNATHRNLAFFLKIYLYVTCVIFSKRTWQRTRASLHKNSSHRPTVV